MSKYTTEVRFICETLAEFDTSQGYGKVSDILNASWDKIFDFDFPIFDENYRSVLCKKILKHYYTREIGLETVGLWKLKLDTKMNEIMPYYNKMYESAEIKFNPLYDADYTRTTSGEENGENERNKSNNNTARKTGTISNSGSNNGSNVKTGTVGTTESGQSSNTEYNLFSDTPQGALTRVDNETYLTNVHKITNNGGNNNTSTTTYNVTDTSQNSNSNTQTFNTTDTINGSENEGGNFTTTKEYVEHIVGKFPGKSYAKTIMEFRESLINVDLMVIDVLSELFMKVW